MRLRCLLFLSLYSSVKSERTVWAIGDSWALGGASSIVTATAGCPGSTTVVNGGIPGNTARAFASSVLAQMSPPAGVTHVWLSIGGADMLQSCSNSATVYSDTRTILADLERMMPGVPILVTGYAYGQANNRAGCILNSNSLSEVDVFLSGLASAVTSSAAVTFVDVCSRPLP